MDEVKKNIINWTEANCFGDNDLRISKDAHRAIRRSMKQELKKDIESGTSDLDEEDYMTEQERFRYFLEDQEENGQIKNGI